MSDQLSPEQLKAMMDMNIKPAQAAAVSGHATGLLSNFIGTAGQFAMGAAKGLGQDVADLTSLAGNVGQTVLNQTAGRTVNAVEGKGFTSPGTPYAGNQMIQQANVALQPTSPAEAAGKGTEQIAELAVPFMGVIGKTIEEAPTLARALTQASLRLSPTQIRDYKGAITSVSDFLIKNGVTGNPETRYNKVTDIYDSMESKLSKFLRTNNTARGIFATKSQLLSGVDKIAGDLVKSSSRDIESETAQLEGVKTAINRLFKQEKIPIARLNDFKRSTMKNAFNKAGTKVSDQVEFAVGDLAKGMIENVTTGLTVDGKTVADFNKEYGTAITARKILNEALGKSQVGNIESRAMRIFGMVLGGLGGSSLGVTAGAGGAALGYDIAAHAAPELLGTFAKTKTAAALTGLAKAAPKGVTGALKTAGKLKAAELGGDLTNQNPQQ